MDGVGAWRWSAGGGYASWIAWGDDTRGGAVAEVVGMGVSLPPKKQLLKANATVIRVIVIEQTRR